MLNISRHIVFLTISGLHRTQLVPSSCSQLGLLQGHISARHQTSVAWGRWGNPCRDVLKTLSRVRHRRVHHAFWGNLNGWEQFAFEDGRGREASLYQSSSRSTFSMTSCSKCLGTSDLVCSNYLIIFILLSYSCFKTDLCHIRKICQNCSERGSNCSYSKEKTEQFYDPYDSFTI